VKLYKLALLPITLLSCSWLLAQAPQPRSQQVIQESWSVQHGAPEGIETLAQTADGFLWLGGPSGLFRFDGKRFERFHPSSGDPLLASNIRRILAPSSGGLWVGYTFNGFSFVNDGKVKNYREETGSVNGFAQSQDGTVWAGTSRGLWRFEHSAWRPVGADWNAPTTFVDCVGFDRTGTLWVLASKKLLYLHPGNTHFRVAGEKVRARGFTIDADRKVVTSQIAQQKAVAPGNISRDELHAYPILRNDTSQLIDRTNSVWVIADGQSISRIQAPEQIESALTNVNAGNSEVYDIQPESNAYLVDREGNIWFSDSRRIYRFFYSPLIKQEFSSVPRPFAIAAGNDGSVWIGSWHGSDLYHVANRGTDTLQVLKTKSSDGWSVAYKAVDKTLWFGGEVGLWHLVNGKFVQIALPKEMADEGGFLQAMTEDRAGGLWISFGRHGLYRLANGVWTLFGGREDLPKTGVVSEFTDSLRRVWFGCTNNQLAVLDGDKVKVFGPGDGLRVGNITAIYGRGPEIWIGGEFGLQRFDHGRFDNIVAVDNDWLLGISGIVETADGDLWLNGLSGIFHIGRAEISEALRDPSHQVKGEHLGGREGLPGFAVQIRPLPSAIEGSDGRVWFAGIIGVAWLDPSRRTQKAPAPPITVQSVYADDKNYDAVAGLTLPAHTSSVQISYAAVSLSAPEAIRFRYKLQETDSQWHEVSSASPVLYRNLSPGAYHFMVGASDTNGVWADKVANVDFTILPAWYQTAWFRASCVSAFLLLLWGLYQLRLLRLRRQFHLTLEARVGERTRIARELHDTLLQSFHGLLLRFHAASNLLPARPEEAKQEVESAIEQASNAITEGRDAVHELRSGGLTALDLAQSINNFGKELLSHPANGNSPEFRLQVEGTPRNLNPMVRDEVYRIAVEALRNAIRHAGSGRIEMEIRYDQQHLRLRIRDDGRGIDPAVLEQGRAPGQWGLRGMHERAKLVGGSLEIWSEPGSGTEIELTIPAANAYAEASASRWSILLRNWRS
jgi:signal transduction histidine kinase/ligand-binding sensor domain-containing protein